MNHINHIYHTIANKNLFAAKKLKRYLKQQDEAFYYTANHYLERYNKYLHIQGLTLDYGVDCYLKLLQEMVLQRKSFLEKGHYANTSFDEVNKAVYANPEIMNYHMHGLLLAQFLWPDQYQRFLFFRENLQCYRPIHNYLEVGGGHGLYIAEAFEQLGKATQYDLVDISESSLQLAKGILNNSHIHYHHKDIFEFENRGVYDFITIGEVIEHLENPLQMLIHLHSLLNEGGTVYLTTPVNAPMIDHIYLFNHTDEIRQLVVESGFRIEKERVVISEEVSQETAIEQKLPIMYAAFLKKRQ